MHGGIPSPMKSSPTKKIVVSLTCLGLKKQVALDFLCQAGLVNHSTHAQKLVYAPIQNEWDLFIYGSNLCDYMETITQTRLDGGKIFFINIGNRANLQHWPINQFYGKLLVSSILSVYRAAWHCCHITSQKSSKLPWASLKVLLGTWCVGAHCCSKDNATEWLTIYVGKKTMKLHSCYHRKHLNSL